MDWTRWWDADLSFKEWKGTGNIILGMIYNLKTITQHKAKFPIGFYAPLFLYFCSVLWTHLLPSQFKDPEKVGKWYVILRLFSKKLVVYISYELMSEMHGRKWPCAYLQVWFVCYVCISTSLLWRLLAVSWSMPFQYLLFHKYLCRITSCRNFYPCYINGQTMPSK